MINAFFLKVNISDLSICSFDLSCQFLIFNWIFFCGLCWFHNTEIDFNKGSMSQKETHIWKWLPVWINKLVTLKRKPVHILLNIKFSQQLRHNVYVRRIRCCICSITNRWFVNILSVAFPLKRSTWIETRLGFGYLNKVTTLNSVLFHILHIKILVRLLVLLFSPPVHHDWFIKGSGMCYYVYVILQIKDPLSLFVKSRALCPSDGFLSVPT